MVSTACLEGLYELLVRDYREDDPSKGELVVAEVRPLFNELCELLSALEAREVKLVAVNK